MIKSLNPDGENAIQGREWGKHQQSINLMSIKNFCLTGIVFFSLACFFISCNQTASKKTESKEEKNSAQTKDTSSSDYSFSEPPRAFILLDNLAQIFNQSKPVKRQLYILNEKGEAVAIKTFIEQVFDQRDTSINKALFDLDNDNVRELLIGYYTGGNHCCDGIWIGKKVNDSLYEEAFAIEGGSITMNDKKIFRCIQDERLGYFYSSYACSGDYEFPYDYRATDIQFKYKKGSLVYISDVKNRNQLIQNLTFLSKIPVPTLNERRESDCIGYRKNFAKNIVALYVNDKFDTLSTKKVFYNYYKGVDTDTVWNEVLEYIDPSFTVNYMKKISEKY